MATQHTLEKHPNSGRHILRFVHDRKSQRSTVLLLGLCFLGCAEDPVTGRDAGFRTDVVADSRANSLDGGDSSSALIDAITLSDSADVQAPSPCVCGTGVDSAFDPPADTTLAAGAHHFTTVRIRAGVTVRVTGGEPLVIFSRGEVDIAGVLTLNGGDGRPGVCESSNVPQPGGTAVAGGTAGGAGGARGRASSPGDTALGGRGAGFLQPGGTEGDSAGGGGGGGGSSMMGTMGANGACCPARCPWGLVAGEGAGGRGGAAFADRTLRGGGGGGGGAYGRADNGNGGSGGGGGGAVRIVAPSITIAGSISANGGNGASAGQTAPGGAVAECDGGAGGGGAGGTIWLQSSRVAISGAVFALGGSGGTTVEGMTCGVGGAGGAGSPGLIRLDADMIMGDTTPAAARGASMCVSTPECMR